MRTTPKILWLGILAVLGTASPGLPQAALTADQVMEKNFYAAKVKTLKADSDLVLINAQGDKRVRKVSNLQALQPNGVDSKLLVKFLDPADIRGTGFLQIEHSDADDDQWVYLPALQKSRRLVANNKKDSFFGSDFSYGDITLPKPKAYVNTLKGSQAVDGIDCYVVESVPASESLKEDTGYGKKVSWIRKDDFIEAKVEYYDLSGQLLKVQVTGGVTKAGSNPDRYLVAHREMDNVQTGHKTTLDFTHVQTGVAVDDGVFSTRSLERQ
ncbi:MAG TPA: outer membrane lipoprotein-sorting protein [bacterium]|nr:outer membrane lipoprotein-sorting protein [bacterium]